MTHALYVSAHQVAKKFGHFGHEEVFNFLLENSSPEVKLLAGCWLNDETMVKSLLGDEPNLALRLTESDRANLAHAARNNNFSAVRLMLLAGLPVNGRSQHQATALHWAAWHGNAGMTRMILACRPDLEDAKNDFQSTPLGWAVHGSENGWDRERGNYAETVEELLKSGAPLPEKLGGTAEVREILRRYGRQF